MTEFYFYLDAWNYCQKNNISLNFISRRDWKTWQIEII